MCAARNDKEGKDSAMKIARRFTTAGKDVYGTDRKSNV